MGVRYFGAKVRRVEDPRLITGNGRYVDDIELPGMIEAAMVRSSEAHARIRRIDCVAARALPGVHAVFTLEDFPPEYHDRPMVQPFPAPILIQPISQYPLARDEVCFVGQAIAIVVAETRQLAEDAAGLVVVDYEKLPAVVDCREAVNTDAPLAHIDSPDNVVARLRVAFGEVEDVFADAAHVFEERFPPASRRLSRVGMPRRDRRGPSASRRPHDYLGDAMPLPRASQRGRLSRPRRRASACGRARCRRRFRTQGGHLRGGDRRSPSRLGSRSSCQVDRGPPRTFRDNQHPARPRVDSGGGGGRRRQAARSPGAGHP